MAYNLKNNNSETKKKIPVFRCMKDVESKKIEWLWKYRFPKGKLSILAGDPGLGKSQLSLWMAATISNGSNWPMEDKPADEGNVIIITSEDDVDDTIKPRLEALSANMDKIFILDGIKKKDFSNQDESFGLSKDLDVLNQMIEEIHGASMVIIDPVNGYLDDVDSYNNSEVRRLLTPLSLLASRHKTSVIMVSHPPKTKGTLAVHKVSGSVAFIAAARSGFLIIRDPEEEDRRLMVPIKNNLGSDKNGLSFRIKKILLESGIETSKLEWDPEPISESADFFLNQEKSYKKPSKTDEAEYWLMERLEEGPQPAGDLIRIGEEFGYTPKILRDAGERFNMERYKDGLDHWMWKLPNFKHKSDDQTS